MPVLAENKSSKQSSQLASRIKRLKKRSRDKNYPHLLWLQDMEQTHVKQFMDVEDDVEDHYDTLGDAQVTDMHSPSDNTLTYIEPLRGNVDDCFLQRPMSVLTSPDITTNLTGVKGHTFSISSLRVRQCSSLEDNEERHDTGYLTPVSQLPAAARHMYQYEKQQEILYQIPNSSLESVNEERHDFGYLTPVSELPVAARHMYKYETQQEVLYQIPNSSRDSVHSHCYEHVGGRSERKTEPETTPVTKQGKYQKMEPRISSSEHSESSIDSSSDFGTYISIDDGQCCENNFCQVCSEQLTKRCTIDSEQQQQQQQQAVCMDNDLFSCVLLCPHKVKTVKKKSVVDKNKNKEERERDAYNLEFNMLRRSRYTYPSQSRFSYVDWEKGEMKQGLAEDFGGSGDETQVYSEIM